jgi:hypothetical protein
MRRAIDVEIRTRTTATPLVIVDGETGSPSRVDVSAFGA